MRRVLTLLAGAAAGLLTAGALAVPASVAASAAGGHPAADPGDLRTADPVAADRPAGAEVHRRAGHRAADRPPADPAEPVALARRHQLDAQRRLRLRRLRRSAVRWASNLKVKSASYGVRECATIAFDSHGRIVGLCGGLEGFTMMVIDPVTLKPISELRTSARNLLTGANPFTDICGGTYFFLDGDDVAYPTTGQKTVLKIKVQPDGKLVKQHEWSLAAHVPAERLPDRDDARLGRPDLVLHPAGRRRHDRPRQRRGADDAAAGRRGGHQLGRHRRDRRHVRRLDARALPARRHGCRASPRSPGARPTTAAPG